MEMNSSVLHPAAKPSTPEPLYLVEIHHGGAVYRFETREQAERAGFRLPKDPE